MIVARELRIGNYVNLITDGHEHEPDTFEWTIEDYEYYETEMFKILPIPLTEEWLIKFGFVKDKLEVGLYHFNDLEIFLPNYFTWKTQFINNIKHVHQLQNLYFALTNEELAIK